MSTTPTGSEELLTEIMLLLRDLNKETKKNSSSIGDLSKSVKDLDDKLNTLVKVDHIIYKQNGYIALDSSAQFTGALEAVAMDHQHCRLGQWYYQGEGQASCSHTRGFRALEAPHVQVHRAVQAAVALRDADWIHQPAIKQRIIDAMREAEEQSYAMIQHMDAMLQEKHAALG